MTIDEEDIKVGRFLYFIRDGNNSQHFVGIISEIFRDEDCFIDGPLVKILFPLNPGNSITKTIGHLKSEIEDGHIVIK